METTRLTIEDILDAIARGLQPNQETVVVFVLILILFLAFLALSGGFFYKHNENRRNEEALSPYERLIRQYDLTENEIDYLSTLGRYLRKSCKKELLLTNRTAFGNCLRLHQLKNPDKSEEAFASSISHKAGFEWHTMPVRKSGTRRVFPGAPMKIETEGRGLLSGEVTKVEKNFFEFFANKALPAKRDAITVYLIDLTGISGYRTKIKSLLDNNMARVYHSEERQSSVWKNPGHYGVGERIQILVENTEASPIHGYIRKLRPGWMYLEQADRELKKSTDVRIFLTPKRGNYWVNGEIRRVSRDKRSFKVKLTHIRYSSR